MVNDIIEKNGKTIKENNLELIHNIPIESLVEIIEPELENFYGTRLFVVKHTRDCDGTPLYTLCANKNDKDYHVFGLIINTKHGGFSEENLKVIK
jgi:hypothetical protein